MEFEAQADHEKAFVESFFVPEKRPRYLRLLSTEKGRKKFVSRLPHLDALDTRSVRLLEPEGQTPETIESALRERGAPISCYVVSEAPDLDRHQVPLRAALRAVVGSGMGTFPSCVAGQLAYFEGEEPGMRYICERATPKR